MQYTFKNLRDLDGEVVTLFRHVDAVTGVETLRKGQPTQEEIDRYNAKQAEKCDTRS